MPANDIGVFDYVRSGDEAAELDYLTYAMFAFRKSKWIEHFRARNQGETPNQQQIDDWISQLTAFEFDRMRSDAREFFDQVATDYVKSTIEAEKQKAVDESILSEVKKFTNPWRDLGMALLMAILAPMILGLVVFLFSIFDRTFPIHISFGAT